LQASISVCKSLTGRFFFLAPTIFNVLQISNIVKQFKLSCGKAQSQFQGMEVRNSRFSAFIDAFTANTYIMVIVSNPHVHTAATLLNIQNARTHFERFIPRI
jgi:Ras-related GTP-binding protein A/B